MPVLVIGITAFILFLLTVGLGLLAVHCERKQQVREDLEGKTVEESAAHVPAEMKVV